MKKRTIVLLLLTILLVTGCTPKLTYEIRGSNITENIELEVNVDRSKNSIETDLVHYGFSEQNNYDVDVVEIPNGYDINIKRKKENLETFIDSKSSILDSCFDRTSFIYEEDEDNYYFGTSEGYRCMTYDYLETDGVDITIKTYNKVIENNATTKKGNTYTWNINETNASNSSIIFVVSRSEYVWYYQYRYLFIGLGIVASLFLIVYIIVYIFKRFSDRANRI